LGNRFVWIVLVVMLAFGVVGFVDDYKKLILGNAEGLRPRSKYFWQSVVALAAAYALYVTAETPQVEHALLIPYFKSVTIPLGAVAYIALTYFVSVGSADAVNLADGLDGLAIMPAVLVGGALGVIGWAAGNVVFSSYLG